jgi:hypothetical protein
MKNDNARLKGFALNGGKAKSLRANDSSEVQTRLVALGAFMTIFLLSGCASIRDRGDADAWQYNPNTGYPAVGSDLPNRHL